MDERTALEIKTPRTGEETPEAMTQFLGSLASIKAPSGLFKKNEIPLSFEIGVFDQFIHFYVVMPKSYQAFIESQLLAQYPKALISQVDVNKLNEHFKDLSEVSYCPMGLSHYFLYSLKTFRDFKEVDPLSPLLGMLSKLDLHDSVLVQFMLVPISQSWQGKGRSAIEKKPEGEEQSSDLSAYSKQITDKISFPGFKMGVRILVKSQNKALLGLIGATFTSFNNTAGNSLSFQKLRFWQKQKFLQAILNRETFYIPNSQIFNLLEIATLFHFPGIPLSNIKSISWARTILSDAPENLPLAHDLSDEEKAKINFFGKCEFRNSMATFGIRKNDRRKHVYIIGKTGTGKSTLIANMAINDIRNREGVAIIDPHGDLSEILLDFIPSYRVNDVVYLNPSDVDHPFHLNPLEINNPMQKELIASGIVSIFFKLYGNSWGPRLEYFLRNSILTLLEVPDATLLMVPEILTNPKFRAKVVEKLEDPVLKNFWNNEFNAMSEKFMNEAISPILNKVGQFVASPTIRGIIGHPKSTVRLEDIMNEGKILILNLSQGKIGEDNSALLGAMIITKIQLAAMGRVEIPEEQRRDFYLYVDEFQNFATTSFIKILSEARKYRLNLILANQYIAQIEENVRSAIFGNAGTMLSFIIGAEDAPFMAREFGERFKEPDILSLGNYQMIIKMSIDGLTSSPFLAFSLPLPQSRSQNREKAIRVSMEHYTKSSVKSSDSKEDSSDNSKDEGKSQEKKAKDKQITEIDPPSLNRKELIMRLVHSKESS